jgi:hypothetical protein
MRSSKARGATVAREEPEPIPPPRDGDQLTRDEFERRYDAMPESAKAELIGGVVLRQAGGNLDTSPP